MAEDVGVEPTLVSKYGFRNRCITVLPIFLGCGGHSSIPDRCPPDYTDPYEFQSRKRMFSIIEVLG